MTLELQLILVFRTLPPLAIFDFDIVVCCQLMMPLIRLPLQSFVSLPLILTIRFSGNMIRNNFLEQKERVVLSPLQLVFMAALLSYSTVEVALLKEKVPGRMMVPLWLDYPRGISLS